MPDPAVCVLLTTYQRTFCAVETIRGIKTHLRWPQLWWYISDDHSNNGHVKALVNEIGPSYRVEVFDTDRLGVGYGMNRGLKYVFEAGTDLVLMMEDDWVLNTDLDLRPHVETLNNSTHGLIRFGYLSPNLLGYLISESGKLYWRLDNNGETYRYTGHPSLRHRRFHDTYGYFDENLPPGMTELSMCGKTNGVAGPNILYPADCGQWGFFSHIGSESLADIKPI